MLAPKAPVGMTPMVRSSLPSLPPSLPPLLPVRMPGCVLAPKAPVGMTPMVRREGGREGGISGANV